MSKPDQKDNHDNTLKVIVMVTAALNLVKAIIDVITIVISILSK